MFAVLFSLYVTLHIDDVVIHIANQETPFSLFMVDGTFVERRFCFLSSRMVLYILLVSGIARLCFRKKL